MQITSTDQVLYSIRYLKTSIKTNLLWEGCSQCFLIYPMLISLVSSITLSLAHSLCDKQFKDQAMRAEIYKADNKRVGLQALYSCQKKLVSSFFLN